MRIAIDTNVLGYAEGLDDAARQARATTVLAALADHELVMPLQVAAELHRLIVRRRRVMAAEADRSIARWLRLIPTNPPTTAATFDAARSLVRDHHTQIFDAIIMAAAADADCRMLLSEDMASGFEWRGLTVVDPFADPSHPLLAAALGLGATS